ncbi:hypothetical protein DPMN_158525 [Dreissena polymorpha]|uniref:Uncharacterized protein n=1 Tax=Dreissena polymorpha TaxID=45954 RepID=A0A9D4EMG9_DREPO|nr:hypothetical protein DPMN_158525 [Dreissena polymorpha]
MRMCTCYLAAFIMVSWVFHQDPGVSLVCLTIGSSLGQFIVPYLYEVFIETFALSDVFIMVAGISLQCIPFGVIILCANGYYVTAKEASANCSLLGSMAEEITDHPNHPILALNMFFERVDVKVIIVYSCIKYLFCLHLSVGL